MKLPILFALLIVPASAVVSIDYVTVGNAGNAADPLTGYGSVSYAYNIGKYEVTNAQYTEFLNAADPTGANPNGIYNSSMGSSPLGGIAFDSGAANGSKYSLRSNMGNKPVVFVTWYDSARFTNWLHNGQGSGSTETGAYTLSGNTGLIVKNIGATVWLPTENEWYKAAYYDPTPGAGGGDNYWLYATQSNSVPTIATANAFGDVSNPGANVANHDTGADWNGENGNLTSVGSAGASNYFGTFDQSGNVGEWTDSAFELGNQRVLRGGNLVFGEFYIRSTSRNFTLPLNLESNIQGFRVAAIPEPSTALFTLLSISALLRRRRNHEPVAAICDRR